MKQRRPEELSQLFSDFEAIISLATPTIAFAWTFRSRCAVLPALSVDWSGGKGMFSIPMLKTLFYFSPPKIVNSVRVWSHNLPVFWGNASQSWWKLSQSPSSHWLALEGRKIMNICSCPNDPNWLQFTLTLVKRGHKLLEWPTKSRCRLGMNPIHCPPNIKQRDQLTTHLSLENRLVNLVFCYSPSHT